MICCRAAAWALKARRPSGLADASRYAWQQVRALDDDEILQRMLVRTAIFADDELLASRRLLRQIRG